MLETKITVKQNEIRKRNRNKFVKDIWNRKEIIDNGSYVVASNLKNEVSPFNLPVSNMLRKSNHRSVTLDPT